MPINRKYIEAAKEMYRAYPRKNKNEPRGRPFNETFVDMVTNILLMAHNQGHDPAAILRMAAGHIEAEIGPQQQIGAIQAPAGPGAFAEVKWTVQDVLSLRENWTEEQAENFLEENEKRIKDRLVEEGWDVLEDLLPPEEEDEEEEQEFDEVVFRGAVAPEEEAHAASGPVEEVPATAKASRRTRTTFAP